MLSLCKAPRSVHFLGSCSIRLSGSRVHSSAEEFGNSLESNQERAGTLSNSAVLLSDLCGKFAEWEKDNKGHL